MMMSRYLLIISLQLLLLLKLIFLIRRFDFSGNSWCCSRWTVGNCKSPRSAFVRLCEPKDCCGGSWKVLGYPLEKSFTNVSAVTFISSLPYSAGLGVTKTAVQAVARMAGISFAEATKNFYLIDKDVSL